MTDSNTSTTEARAARRANDAPAREPLRPQLREETSLERARKRAAELRDHLGGVEEASDDFYVSPDIVPDGWVYEWKRKLVLGAEDPTYEVQLARAGWEPVPASRHPEMMPKGEYAVIERKGLLLMERPKEIVDEIRRLEQRRARDQVRAKEAQLAGTPEGTLTRDDPRVAPKIKKGYEPIPVEE
jgi:hypothetical protein